MAWKNIKIQGKFVIGFGSIILLLIALSVISIINIQQIISNAETVISGNKLKSTIIQREVDHLNWESQLSDYLTNKNVTELTVQTDETLCGFGKWYYGEGRREAEALVPQLTSTLLEIEPFHTALHKSAIAIEENYSSIEVSLGNFLREKKVDHLNWKLKLIDFITDSEKTELDIQLDPAKCDLGKWLYSGNISTLLSEHPQLNEIYRNILPVHEDLHQSAETIEGLVSNGNTDDALEHYHEVSEPRAEETLGHIDDFIRWHNTELLDMEKSRTIFSTDTVNSLKGIQSKFGEMISIVNENIMTEDVMLSSGQEAAATLLIISLVIGVISIIVAFVLATTIIRPILKCVTFAEEISLGDLDASLDIVQKDQIGRLCDSLRKVLKGFRDKADVISSIAEGDLTAQIVTLSEKDGLGLSLQKMKTDLNMLIGQIVSAVDQMSSGAEQIAEASQNLSEGAATQASSTEEVSVMVNQISGQAAQNSDNSAQAKGISEKATLDAEKGNRNMADVVSIMEKINGGADETKKIVKVIDDIAFQINLLALNANVEAARAGKYGKGFAVVADEVRNLAVKSAQAAKETSEKVEESIKNITNGSNAVQVSAEQLVEIVKGSRRVSEILEEIAAASKSQDDGISQATGGLDQIDKITQENTGNAEETAAAAEELSSQSLQLKNLVERFKLESSDIREERVKSITYNAMNTSSLSEKRFIPEKRKPLQPGERSPVYSGLKVPAGEDSSTGIKPVNPADVISLDDNDFDQF